MSDYNFGGWGHFGFAAHDDAALDTTYAGNVFTLGEVATIKRSQGIPDDAHLYDITFELSSMPTGAGAPSKISFYLARDSGGTKPLTQVKTVDIVKTLVATSATGGAQANIEVDFHSTSGVGPTLYNTIYIVAKVDAGSASADIYLSWRS